MPLQEQLVEFPIVGGVDEASHPRLCARLLTMRNCRQFKNGSIGKRYGTTAVSSFNARFGAIGTPPVCELLTARGDELVRVGSGQLDSVKAIASTDCVFKGRIGEALVTRRQFSSGDSTTGGADVAYANGYTVLTNLSYRRSTTGLTASTRISVTVIDANGTTVLNNVVVDSGVTTDHVYTPHVLTIGTVAFIVWGHGTNVKARTLDLTTLAFGSITTLVGSLTIETVAACVVGSTIVIAYQLAAGVYTMSFTTALAVSHAAVQASASTSTSPFALEYSTGTNLYLGYAKNTGANSILEGVVVNSSTLAVITAEFAIATGAPTLSFGNIGILPDSTGANAVYLTSTVVFTGSVMNGANIINSSVTSAGSVTTATNNYGLSLSSKPWRDNGQLYALARVVHSTHSSLFIVGLYEPSTAPTVSLSARIVATIAPRQAPKAAENLYDAVLSSVVATASNRYAIGATVSGSVVDSTVTSLLDVRMAATKTTATNTGLLLSLSGGAPSAYDGSHVAELGMAYEPDYAVMSAAVSAGGSMTASKTYYYLATYEYVFSSGAIVRSIPSYSVSYRTTADDGTTLPLAQQGLLSALTTVANKTVTLSIPYLAVTNKQLRTAATATDEYLVNIVLYRTEGDGSIFYRLTSPQPQAEYQNSTAGGFATIVDSLDDVTLRQRPVLYTTGGALPSEIPPSAGHIAVIQQRVFLSSTDDDTIWFSDVIVEGEAPAFSGSKTLAPFTGGLTVGMAALDEKFIVLKERSLWYFTGDGPGIDGLNGTFSYPVPIASDLGCVEPRSIVTTPIGVMFQSQNGIALIGRDLSVSLIGKGIEDTLGSTAITAATVVPNQELVRFTLASGTTLEFDLYHGGAWGSCTYSGHTFASSVFTRGAWYAIDSAGAVIKEDTTLWTDAGVFVPSTVRLKYISLASLQGYQRAWWVGIDGDRKTAFDLTMKAYIEEDASYTETRTWTANLVSAWPKLQAQQHIVFQECEGLSLEVSDATPTVSGAIGTGQGFVLFAVSAEVGVDPGIRRVPTAQTK